ncbi:hypothetical protein EON67_06845 [archaeon]|nr:MAG: hypothetical protein EON67_06845 [archaeon]
MTRYLMACTPQWLLRALLLLLPLLHLLCPCARAASSDANARLAADNYPHDPIQRFIATHCGDEMPNMRDDLIRRKADGQGLMHRHVAAWLTLRNWQLDWPAVLDAHR